MSQHPETGEPLPSQDPNTVGTFVTPLVIGYVALPPERAYRLNERLRYTQVLQPDLLESFLAIKLLAPEASRTMAFMSGVGSLLHPLRDQLVREYLQHLRKESPCQHQ
jgi:hypothetical protein